MDTPARLSYRPEIDGLRALAVIMVVLFHAGLGFPGGFVGVDIFFVISGYLITSLLLKDFDQGHFSFVGFYERRARRILPASLLVTAIILCVGYREMLPLDLQRLGNSALAHVVGGANVYFWKSVNYFGGSAEEMPLLHMWSLAVEEQFYLIFPLFLWICYRPGRTESRRRWTITVLIAVFVVSLGISVYQVRSSAQAAFFMLPSRAWELMCGALVAAAPLCTWPRAAREISSVLAMAAMILAGLLYTAATPFPGLAALLPCLGAAAFIWACDLRSGSTFIGRLLASRGAVAVGLISYSLYLCHWPILVFARYWRVAELTRSDRWLLVLLSFAAAVMLWAIAELPFRRRLIGGTRRSIYIYAACAAAAVIALGFTFRATEGLPNRFPTTVNTLDAVRRQKPRVAQLDAEDVRSDRLVPFGDANADAPVSLMVWGDSHAAVALPAFQDVCAALHISGRAATHSSTSPLLDYYTDDATGLGRSAVAYNRAVLDYITRHHVKAVFLVNFWQRDIDQGGAKFPAALKRTIAAINATGATVYIMLQVPTYDVDVPKAMAYEAMGHAIQPPWRKTLAAHYQQQAAMYALAKKLESADCHFIDPAPLFLPRHADLLSVSDRQTALYRDAHHLTVTAAKRMLDALLKKVIMAATRAN